MKRVDQCRNSLGFLIVLIALIVIFNSCSEYNFSEPQPVNKEDIKEFPAEFLGTWTEPKTDTFIQEPAISAPVKVKSNSLKNLDKPFCYYFKQQPGRFFSEDSLSFLISKNYLTYIVSGQVKIAIGAWPRLDNQKEFVYPSNLNEWVSEINYDSLKNPVDTIDNYFIKGDLIYEVTNEKRLGKGNKYSIDKNVITIMKEDSITIDMGKNAFLRKLDDHFYVYNIRHWILGEESLWWKIFLLEKTGTNSMNVWECNSTTRNLPSMFYNKPCNADIFYFNSRWTSDEMVSLIKENYFEVTSNLIRVVPK